MILQTGQRQHHAIVDAIEAGQADLAELLMRGHSAPARKTLGLDGKREGDTRGVAL